MLNKIDDPQAMLNAICRGSFLAFFRKGWSWIESGQDVAMNWHLDAMAHRLDRVAKGESQRLIINIPPRNGKSNMVSVLWVAWMLGKDPTLNFVCVSYSNELSEKLARICLSVMMSPWYKAMFPDTVISPKRSATHDYETTAGGGRLATSITGTLTGRGGDIIVLDDVIKPDAAASETTRNTVNNWYRSTLASRLNNKATGSIICVMQRLHQYDLTGLLLEDDSWDHLSLPAVAEEDAVIPLTRGRIHVRKAGDVLHPERDSREELFRMQALMGSYLYAAQYQQQPIPELGNIIQRDWLQLYEALTIPSLGGEIVQSWDTGIKTKEGHDYSVCITARIWQQRIYITDLWRDRLEYPNLERKCAELARFHNVHTLLIEDKASGQELIQSIRGKRPQGVPMPLAINPVLDKTTRAVGVSSIVEAGQLYVPATAHWLDSFGSEIAAFPQGRHNDQVDALSQLLDFARRRLHVSTSLSVGPSLYSEDGEGRMQWSGDTSFLNGSTTTDPWGA